jgi:hypothetical protein
MAEVESRKWKIENRNWKAEKRTGSAEGADVEASRFLQ